MLEKVFKLSQNKTNVKTEVMAGITTFMTMAYILAVNPSILSAAGMDSTAVLVATALASFIGTAAMALMASATVMIISSCCFGLGFEVKMDGQSLGYVEDPEQVTQLVERVESRISEYLNAPYSLDVNLSYSMRYMDRTEPLDEELLEQRLFASVDDESRRYVLKVDDEVIGASESRTALELMLRRILFPSNISYIGRLSNIKFLYDLACAHIFFTQKLYDFPAIFIRQCAKYFITHV